jgi:hypothetical protein
MPAAYSLDDFTTIIESDNFSEQYGHLINPETIIASKYKLPDVDKYVLPIIETQLGNYEVTSIEHLPEDVIKENLLIYPYRVHGKLVDPSEVYENYPEMLKQLSKTCNLAIDNLPDYENFCKNREELFLGERD